MRIVKFFPPIFQIADDQRSAELEGLYSGIRKILPLKEFRTNWQESVRNVYNFANVSEKKVSELKFRPPRNLDDSEVDFYKVCFNRKD